MRLPPRTPNLGPVSQSNVSEDSKVGATMGHVKSSADVDGGKEGGKTSGEEDDAA
jgi:hypothetical protein